MKLTPEQYDIVHSTGNIKINAVAGSGKTTTIIAYASERPPKSRILYLAFNKSVKLEAVKKFAEKGLKNVKVETAHSLAFKHVVPGSGYRVSGNGYKANEIADILGLDGNGEKHGEYIIANHVNKFAVYFCNSDKQQVQELNYLETLSDAKARNFVAGFYKYLEKQTRILLAKMNSGEIEITHDFYLKKFQLSNPTLHYDYILFDEGQDASAAMLDVFINQKATKVIVGDTHQQIYGWRHAVNSLEKTDFKTYQLSTSFRFGEGIAKLAIASLALKKHLGQKNKFVITGAGSSTQTKTKAVLARTNLGLLVRAIKYVTGNNGNKKIYFEGNINSYTYADDGASLYDVLNLYNGKRNKIRDKLVAAMHDLEELEEFVEKTEDKQLGMMIEIVKDYGNDIPWIIKDIKDRHVANDEKEKAELIFSTVHRCKGMEYDSVLLANDFITEKTIEKQKSGKADKDLDPAKVNEEINLLYVAITRAKTEVHIPESIAPDAIPLDACIKIIAEDENEESFWEIKKTKGLKTRDLKTGDKTGDTKTKDKEKTGQKERAYSVDAVRENHKKAYSSWTDDLDEELTALFCEGKKINFLTTHFGRTKGAIQSRVKKLGL